MNYNAAVLCLISTSYVLFKGVNMKYNYQANISRYEDLLNYNADGPKLEILPPDVEVCSSYIFSFFSRNQSVLF